MPNASYIPEKNTKRWVAYFDLLGTQRLIRTGRIHQVFKAYATASEKLNAWSKRHPHVSHAWFSDTFILYTNTDSALSFRAIDLVCRWFIFSLLRAKIPVRGALACGTFYADGRCRIYLGEALIEAYEWGENQDWIGFLLTPSAASRLESVGLPPLQRLNYRAHDVPFKRSVGQVPLQPVACLLGNWIRSSKGENFLLKPLRQMHERESEDQVCIKYERTIAFLEKYETREPYYEGG